MGRVSAISKASPSRFRSTSQKDVSMGPVPAITKVSPSRFRSATQAGNSLGGSLFGGSLLLGTVTGQRNDAATSGFWVWARLGVRLNPTNTGSRNNRDDLDSMRTPNPTAVGTRCWLVCGILLYEGPDSHSLL